MSEVKFKVTFGKVGRRQASQKPVPGFAATDDAAMLPSGTSAAQAQHVSRTARLLALAYYVERRIDEGTIKDYAEAARVLGMSRGRVSQVINLLLLPADRQQAILTDCTSDSERRLRATRMSELLGAAPDKSAIRAGGA